MLKNYIVYLNFINEKLNKFFERQKAYIFCKKGCAKCCKNAEFPYSDIELKYLLSGASKLPLETMNLIDKKIGKILEDKKNFKGKRFLYDCPFLIDDVCTVYEFRGIVCRTFGLATSGNENGKVKVPFCAYEGLNYSNVVDGDKISKERFEEFQKTAGNVEEPVGFHIGYDFLTGEDFEKSFNIKFGNKKPLIEWFKV